MSFVNATTFVIVDSANTDEHMASKVCPCIANREKLYQLVVCTQRFAKWYGGMDAPCLHYQDSPKVVVGVRRHRPRH